MSWGGGCNVVGPHSPHYLIDHDTGTIVGSCEGTMQDRGE